MRGVVAALEARTPSTLAEALALLKNEPARWRPLAGGTDLMVLVESGQMESGQFLNLQSLKELQGITLTDSEISIGALTSFSKIRSHALIAKEFPLLAAAAASIGAIAIQNRGTIGGNIANASPAADAPPALLVYDAEIEILSTAGTRRISYTDFHKGYKQTALRSDELIQRIILPRTPTDHWISHYRKVGTRNAQAISKISFAARAKLNPAQMALSEIKIAFGSVAPTVLRGIETESFLKGCELDRKAIVAAKAILTKEISPIDDVRSNREYRLQVSLNLLEDFLTSLKTKK